MIKIYTKSVFEYNNKTKCYEVNEKESQFHFVPNETPIAQMKGGGSTQGTGPWSPQQPYIKRGFQEAQNSFLNQPDFSPLEQESQGLIANQARNGMGNAIDAYDLNKRTIAGDYLTGGKGFDAALEAAKNKILPSVNSQFEAHGRGGSGLADVAKASAIGDSFAGLYGQERQNQIAAGNNATNQNNTNLNAMNSVGSTQSNARRTAIMNFLKSVGGDYGKSPEQDQQMQQWLKTLLATGGGAAQGFVTGGWPGAAAGGAAGAAGSFS